MDYLGSGCTDKAYIDSKKTMDNHVEHIYSEVIHILDIVVDGEPKKSTLLTIQKSQKHGVYADNKFTLLSQSSHQSSLLNTFTSEHLPHQFLLHPSQNPTYNHECRITKFVPVDKVRMILISTLSHWHWSTICLTTL